MDTTWLKWPMTRPKTRADFLKTVLYTTGEFAIEDLSIMVRNAFNVILDSSFDAAIRGTWLGEHETHDIFLRRVRIHFLVFAGRPSGDPSSDPQFCPELGWWGITNPANSAMTLGLLGVTNVEVSDCEFEFMQQWLEMRNGRIVNNRFTHQISRFGWTDLGGEYLVIEGNQFIGACSFRRGILRLRYLYIAHNYNRCAEQGERESFTIDLPHNELQGIYWGKLSVYPIVGSVMSSEAKMVKLKGVKLEPNAYRGFDLFVLSGKGAGQIREVVANTEETVTVAMPFDVPLDETSTVVLCKMTQHIICYANRADDTSVIHQL